MSKILKVELSEEQKKYAAQIESYKNDISGLKDESKILNEEAEVIEYLLSTFCMESIYGIENLIKKAIKDNTDKNDIKEVKNEIKNFETILAFESLLNEYKMLAADKRAVVKANINEIKTYDEKIKELDEKITNYQVKLDLGDSNSDNQGNAASTTA